VFEEEADTTFYAVVGCNGTSTFAGTIVNDGDATIPVVSGAQLSLTGTLNVQSDALLKADAGVLRLSDTHIAGTGAERLDFASGGSSGTIVADISTGTTRAFDGFVGSPDATASAGTFTKAGSGTFAANRYRVSTLNINEGTLKVTSSSGGSGTLDIVGDPVGTSRVGTLTIATNGSGTVTATMDLRNNDLIVDYTGGSPIGSLSSGTQGSGIARV
jgi:hypothetical protein